MRPLHAFCRRVFCVSGALSLLPFSLPSSQMCFQRNGCLCLGYFFLAPPFLSAPLSLSSAGCQAVRATSPPPHRQVQDEYTRGTKVRAKAKRELKKGWKKGRGAGANKGKVKQQSTPTPSNLSVLLAAVCSTHSILFVFPHQSCCHLSIPNVLFAQATTQTPAHAHVEKSTGVQRDKTDGTGRTQQRKEKKKPKQTTKTDQACTFILPSEGTAACAPEYHHHYHRLQTSLLTATTAPPLSFRHHHSADDTEEGGGGAASTAALLLVVEELVVLARGTETAQEAESNRFHSRALHLKVR